MELCACPQCGLPAEVVSSLDGVDRVEDRADPAFATGRPGELVGVRCVGRHWFFGLRERLVA